MYSRLHSPGTPTSGMCMLCSAVSSHAMMRCAILRCAVLGGRYGNIICLQALKSKLEEQTALAEEAASKQSAMHNSILGDAEQVNTLALCSCSGLCNMCSKLLRGCTLLFRSHDSVYHIAPPPPLAAGMPRPDFTCTPTNVLLCMLTIACPMYSL